ncbi:MAG: NADH-quinone oxidoreductase subunit M, partial [Nitrospiraceae bacterium]
MLLVWLIVIPFLAGPLAWLSEHRGHQWPRWISLAALAVDLVLGLVLWVRQSETIELTQQGKWIAEWSAPWISRWGITFHVAMDGLSLLLVLLTAFLGGMAVFSSWTEINERVGFFHFNVLWVLTGVIGVFLAMDLFLFFLFWEVMLIPMYFIINIWGHEDRVYAALKFFLFTHAGSLLMLIAILALVFINYQHSRIITFDYFR